MSYDPRKIKVVNQRDLNNLHPLVKDMVVRFIKEVNDYFKGEIEVKVISTLRDWGEQERIYNQGRTTPGKIVSNAKPGKSIHNWGCAIDIGVFKDGKYLTDDKLGYYKKIGPLGLLNGFTWGGNFKTIKDMPHYEYTGKYTSSQFIKLANEGKSIDEILGE